MVTNATAPATDFTRDVLGRYLCNGLDEAIRSADSGARPDARPFDIIVIGGGSFGGVLAQHLFHNDKTHSHRILVLEGGPFLLPEHVQNLPMLGLNPPAPSTTDPGPRAEVWGLPWQTDVQKGFPGLAYCIGGRSLYFGGWSPQLLDAEMARWPAAVTQALKQPNGYFFQASQQIGTSRTNDYIQGALHEALRGMLFNGINNGLVPDAVPLAELPMHLEDAPLTSPAFDMYKLEAPLAVQGGAPRSGYYPFNKFSSVPLMTEATRAAQAEAGGDDVKKRLMIVPNCHVTRLLSVPEGNGWRVAAVATNLGMIGLPTQGKVIIALGTIMVNGVYQKVQANQAPRSVAPFATRRDGLGTTHYECGTLAMGSDPLDSVTDLNGRLHFSPNTYVSGPALFPSIGSPNPMLTGVALARRMGDTLVPPPAPFLAEAGFTAIFNGFDMSKWSMSKISNQPPDRSNPGRFLIVDGTLEYATGGDLGLLWYTEPMPANYILRLQWLRWDQLGNSGVFVRFPNPNTKGYNNTAYVAIDFGFEVQIDEAGAPDGADKHLTGAIYNEDNQVFTRQTANPPGQWNDLEIEVLGQTYSVFLNGQRTARFTNTHPGRGLPGTPSAPAHIGLQGHRGSRVAFRHIRIKPLP